VVLPLFAENACLTGRARRITSPARANEVVYFSITNIQHDVMQNDTAADVYVGSTLGELGCWVDPSITRMIQTGVQHSWIPDLGKYIELGN
jgi:peroxin-6